ncbi:major histocompatibility complex class I-related gene protein-like isoform X2 [Tachysurus fulvidraco]|uniref:major histocompatibility complex class I-related gene protein-like isoform X2 n=1 Tax=Tachysurus fulvidraco TaxID=1234273 RepID=UPI001FEE1EF0|nr:major histocompatibility complex class I-related gene protein-like isoform X2 [Tachysurus fulvidraco]
MGRITVVFSLLFCAFVPAFGGEHSLFYTYTALSKPLELPGIYEFTALGMLDDRELDYYSSKTQVKVPKQDWMKEKMEKDYWDKGTQSRKSKEQWFKVNVDILMERMRHNKSDLHVLQWRHGCVIEAENGNTKFLRGIDEYSYDGSEFLSFDDKNSRWIAPVQAAEPTKRKWDDVSILNTYTKSYLEKECVDWLIKFMGYGQEELRKHSEPDVQIFAKKCVKDTNKLTLSCLATGFYPKDIQMYLRKGRTILPDHLVTTTGVRPNGDGTYQQRKSLDILVEEKDSYDCYVNHITLDKPIVIDGRDGEIPCLDCTVPKIQGGIIGGAIGAVLTLLVVAVVVFVLKKMGIISWQRNSSSSGNNPADVPLKDAKKEADRSSACDSALGSSSNASSNEEIRPMMQEQNNPDGGHKEV